MTIFGNFTVHIIHITYVYREVTQTGKLLVRGLKYSLMATLKGPNTDEGRVGPQSLVCNDVAIRFGLSSYNKNGSGVTLEQLILRYKLPK